MNPFKPSKKVESIVFDYPELVSIKKEKEEKEAVSLNYSAALNKTSETNEPVIVKQKVKGLTDPELSYQEKARAVFQKMFAEWKKYEEDYDELNGPGSYNERYRMSAEFYESVAMFDELD